MRRGRPNYISLRELLVAGITAAGIVLANIASDLAAGVIADWFQGAGFVFVGLFVVWTSILIGRWQRRLRRPSEDPPEPPEPPERLPPAGAATELPPVAEVFRSDELLAEIEHALTTPTTRAHTAGVAVTGRRGVGTSMCAKEVAHRVRDRFPGGVVYLNLRAGRRPLPAHQVVAALAHRFGSLAPRGSAHGELQQCVRLLGEQLDADTQGRVLVVLDNVDHAGQVRDLLELANHCRLLMAGQGPELGELGVDEHRVAMPTPQEAKQMLLDAFDVPGSDTPEPEPEVVADLVRLCGHQPRAVRAVGYRLGRNRWHPEELRDAIDRAVTTPPHERILYVEALELLARQDVAYAALSPAARRMVRRFSLAPGPLDRDTAAVLVRPQLLRRLRWPGLASRWAAHRAAENATDLLNELVDAGFVHAVRHERYELEQELVSYTRLHLCRDEPTYRRRRVQVRLMQHLGRQAARQAGWLPVAGGDPSQVPADAGDPCRWFEGHHGLLRRILVGLAVGPTAQLTLTAPSPATPGTGPTRRWRGRTTRGRIERRQPLPRGLRRSWFRLARALCCWYAAADMRDQWEEVCRAVLETPTAQDRRRVRSWALNELGVIHHRRGERDQAVAVLSRALSERGHWGQSQVLTNLGLVELERPGGDVEQAVTHLEEALSHRSTSDAVGRARTELALGAAHLHARRPDVARHHLEQARDLFEAVDDARGYADALAGLGLAEDHDPTGPSGRDTLEDAVRHHVDLARATCAELDDLEGRAAALLNHAAALCKRPRRAGDAHTLLEEALSLWPDDHGTGRRRSLLYLGDAAWHRAGEAAARAEEVEAHRQWDEGRRLRESADELREAARQHWDQARHLADLADDTDCEAAAQRRLSSSPPFPPT